MSEQTKHKKLNPQPLSSSKSVSPYRSIMAAFFIALIGFFGGQALGQKSAIHSFSQAAHKAEQGKLPCGNTSQVLVKMLCSPTSVSKGITIQGVISTSTKTSLKLNSATKGSDLVRLNAQTKIFTSSGSQIITQGEKVFVIEVPGTNFAKFIFILN